MHRSRQSNFELLRIVCMAMIIVSHYCCHGGILVQGNATNIFLAQLLRLGGKLGVTGFILITGYFMCEKQFKISSGFKVAFQTMFYSIAVLAVCLFLKQPVGVRTIISQVFSPIYSVYWFVTAYIGLYMFIPFLNVIIRKINRGGVIRYLTVVVAIIPFVFVDSNFIVTDIIWFCFLYLIGAYIKYDSEKIKNTWKVKCTFVVAILCMWFSSVIISTISSIMGIAVSERFLYYFSATCSPFMLAAGICLFIAFKDMNITNGIINKLGGVTFACYLLHDNPIIRTIIWNTIFHTERYYDRSIFLVFLNILICIVAIFLFAIVTETIRRIIENKLFSLKYWKMLDDKINNMLMMSNGKEKSDM